MELLEKFCRRIDSDNGYDNVKLAEDLEALAKRHYEQCYLNGDSEQLACEICGEVEVEEQGDWRDKCNKENHLQKLTDQAQDLDLGYDWNNYYQQRI